MTLNPDISISEFLKTYSKDSSNQQGNINALKEFFKSLLENIMDSEFKQAAGFQSLQA